MENQRRNLLFFPGHLSFLKPEKMVSGKRGSGGGMGKDVDFSRCQKRMVFFATK